MTSRHQNDHTVATRSRFVRRTATLLLGVMLNSSLAYAADDKCVDPSKPGRSQTEVDCAFQIKFPSVLRGYLGGTYDSGDMTGFMTVGFNVKPTGQISESWLIDSDLPDTLFVNEVIQAIPQVDIGAKDVGDVEGEYTIKFVRGVPFASN